MYGLKAVPFTCLFADLSIRLPVYSPMRMGLGREQVGSGRIGRVNQARSPTVQAKWLAITTTCLQIVMATSMKGW
jgi:hypothetical protein